MHLMNSLADRLDRSIAAQVDDQSLGAGPQNAIDLFESSLGFGEILERRPTKQKIEGSAVNGIAEALPQRKSTLTFDAMAFARAISTKVWLMSKPVTSYSPSFASSIAKYPGPGARSRMRLWAGIFMAVF